MTLRTPICDLLGIEVPIFAAGMGGVTMAPLAAAVSAAGGCGVLGATFSTPEELREEIRAVRQITDKPFGVDIMVPGDIPEDLSARQIPPFPDFLSDLLPKVKGLKGNPPPPLTIELARAQLAVTLEEKVPLLVSALGTPRWLIEECHAAGTKVMSMVGSVRHARKLEEVGVDALVAQGMEAGGHVGSVTTMVLVPGVVDAVKVPVLAAGGIVDGRGIAAGLVLGAQGAWIGTRFIATREATAHENHKQGILKADENGTVVSRCYTGKTSRVLQNEFTMRWKGRETEILPMPWQRIWVESLVAPAKAAGMMDIANFPTGQGAGAITDLPPAAELFGRLVDETERALAR
ncbi:MAG TPA: nitronate monooxygenase [Pseudomonadales bacterium]|nr:nitronate monooxygenase [Pseudomonadales bacterium]